MPTYRIYYESREPTQDDRALFPAMRVGDGIHRQEPFAESEWEEEIEAESPIEALDVFFREHVPDRSRIGVLDDDGNARRFEDPDFDPEATYIWVENDQLMEYQGWDEATPGMVSCPLCNGHGEVEEAIAQEFHEVWDGDEETVDADVKG